MNLIIDFYKDLDTINLVLFWGIILTIVLLLIFSLIIVNKNKKLKRIIITKEKEIKESRNELAIKQNIVNEEKIIVNRNEDFLPIKEEKEEITINKIENKDVHNDIYIENTQEEDPLKILDDEEELPIKKEVIIKKEEPPIKKEVIIEKEVLPIKEEEFIAEDYVKPTKEIIMPTGPYQRNVLREISSNQTSPIGITRKEYNQQREILNRERNETINSIEKIEESLPSETYKNNYREEMDNSKKMINKLYELEQKNNDYLKEVSKKLEETAKKNEIERTAYEIKQEEDAIISYDELMRKKDSLKMEDDEDAIISIEELRRQKLEKERIYNITKEEENDEFISELKEFRSDL